MGWRGEQPAGMRAGNPAQGYYAGGGLLAGGSGSGKGAAMAGRGQFASGQGVTMGGQEWHPTILYLIAFIIAEMVVFGFIARHLK